MSPLAHASVRSVLAGLVLIVHPMVSAVSAQEASPVPAGVVPPAVAVPGAVDSLSSSRASVPAPAPTDSVAVPVRAEAALAASAAPSKPSDSTARPDSGAGKGGKGARVRKTLSLAVSDLIGKGVTQPEADLITEQVRASMIATGTFKVMERSMMDQIMKEQGFQQSGSCDNSDCMVQVGRVLGVQNLIVGSVGKVGRIFMINVKLVDVETGEVLRSMTETCECEIEQLLRETPKKVASNLELEFRKTNSGSILVQSQPVGASVYLDNSLVGATPWASELLDPGEYSVALILPDWKRVERKIQVEAGRKSPFHFSLERSEEWISAQKAAEERERRAEIARQEELKRQAEAAKAQKKLFWRVGLSAISALCAGGGYYFQTLVDDNASAGDKEYQRYQQATDLGVMAQSKASIDAYDKAVERNRTMRNISFGLGAVALSSITFTFFF